MTTQRKRKRVSTQIEVYNKLRRGKANKTWWDWLQLSMQIVSAVLLPWVLFWATQTISTQQSQAVADQQRNTLLQNYFDKISELVLNKNLNDPNTRNGIGAIARARTLTTLSSLYIDPTHPDAIRKGILLEFLYESGLIGGFTSFSSEEHGDKPRLAIIDLTNADFNGACLPLLTGGAHPGGINLDGINLNHAKLEDVTMERVGLDFASLEFTDFVRADLHIASLYHADIAGAVFYGADLTQTHIDLTSNQNLVANSQGLNGADLRGAEVIDHDGRPVDVKKLMGTQTPSINRNYQC